jgi:hypothetical protein
MKEGEDDQEARGHAAHEVEGGFGELSGCHMEAL